MLQLLRFGIGGREGRDGGVTTWTAAKEGKKGDGEWRCQKKRNESEREKEREGAEVQF